MRTPFSRRPLARRLAAVASRLDAGAPFGERHERRLHAVVDRLELAAHDTAARIADARAEVVRLEQALDAVPQGVVVCDERGEVVYRNRLAAGLAGARDADVLAEQEVQALLGVSREGSSERRTLDLYGPPRRTLVLRGLPLDDGRRHIGAAVVIDDVSERRRVEAMRRDFVANISHELKTPVGALGLLAETLLAEKDPEVTNRLARRMQSEALRVGRIIDDLLDLSRIEAEETPHREPVPAQLVVAEAVERVRALAEARGIVLAAPDPPAELSVLGDRRQLVSAVFNLLENAVKYSDDGAPVTVTVTTDHDGVAIAVADRGVGIPARDLERVFERFYRVDRARARDTGGTGLGLAIVRHVAANHGGEITVTSHEGEGSTFTLRLAAVQGTAAVAAGAP